MLRSEALKVASEHGIQYFETSARENLNVREVMLHIMGQVYENLYGAGSRVEERESIVIGAGGGNQGKES